MPIPVTPQLIATIRALLRKRSHGEILKWDRNQPRGPKGSSVGGQWVKDVSQGTGDPQSTGHGWTTTPGMEKGGGSASYGSIMAAPMATGFANNPRGDTQIRAGLQAAQVAEEEAAQASVNEARAKAAAAVGDIKGVLESAEVEDVLKTFSGGVNTSVKVRLNDPEGTKAVYKPEAGEEWGDGGGFYNSDITNRITNKGFSLAEREAMAFEVDHALGLGLVPPTVLRESLDVPGLDTSSGSGGGSGGGGYDSYQLQEMYDEYKRKIIEGGTAYDEVGQEMGEKFNEAKDEHVTDVNNRVEEMQEIWDGLKQEYPDNSQYGSASMLRGHPVLPMGSQSPFQRQDDPGALVPLDLLDEAEIDVSSAMSDHEKAKLTEVLRDKLEQGYREIDAVDEDAAREHLDYDKWLEDHADTENRLLSAKIKSFDSWRTWMGYGGSGGGSGGGGERNPDAPHSSGGSLQHYIEGLSTYDDVSYEDGIKLAVLDYAIGSMDRHGGNIMFSNHRPVAIDNGYSMPGTRSKDAPDGFTFRSKPVKEWLNDARSHRVPKGQRDPILQALNATDWQALLARHPNMSRAEKEAFSGRIDRLREALQDENGLHDLWHDQDLME